MGVRSREFFNYQLSITTKPYPEPDQREEVPKGAQTKMKVHLIGVCPFG